MGKTKRAPVLAQMPAPGDAFEWTGVTTQRVEHATATVRRMATATAMLPTTIIIVEKEEMKRQLQAQPAFSYRFLSHMLLRNIRIEGDLVDQLFNSSEKRLARTLLLLARYGQQAPPAGAPR